MEGFPYSAYPDSDISSPQCREIDGETAISWDETPLPPAVRVKFMCSYGGRIQPRPHDNQLSYFGGDTKILGVDRSIRFQAIVAKLASLHGAIFPDEICFKYQLPGEDLDALVSVTNDEDLEHMMLEYDRLLLSSGKPAARLRLFLFPSIKAERKSDRIWLLDPPQPAADQTPSQVPDLTDFLSDAVLPPAAASSLAPASIDCLSSNPGKEERAQISGETEAQKQIQGIQSLQIANSQIQPQVQGDEEAAALARVYNGEYYARVVHEKAPTQPVYLIPQSQMYTAAGGHGYYMASPAASAPHPAAFSRVVPTMYAGMDAVPANSPAVGYAAPQMAYDSAGRAVFYHGMVATYHQPVSNVAMNSEPKLTMPSQIS